MANDLYGTDPLFGQSPTGEPPSPIDGDLALKLREVISNAYGFVRGSETVSSFSAITFEDLAQQQLDRLTGKGTATRPNLLARTQRIEADLVAIADRIKQTPPEAFLPPSSDTDVNTPV